MRLLLLASFALGLLAVIRPEELGRLKWADVDLQRRWVTTDVSASKVRRRRIVELHPTAALWLQSCALVTPEECEAFWAILPKKTQAKSRWFGCYLVTRVLSPRCY